MSGCSKSGSTRLNTTVKFKVLLLNFAASTLDWLAGLLSSLCASSSTAGAEVGFALGRPPKLGLPNFFGLLSEAAGASVVVVVVILRPPKPVRLPPPNRLAVIKKWIIKF